MTQEAGESTLPLIEDFSESSLLDQIKVETKEEETLEEKEAKEEERLAKEEEEKVAKEAADLAAKELEEDELTEEEKKELEAKKKEEENSGSFWEDVETITGTTYEVDYGEVDPDTPEGAAIREKVVADTAVSQNLEYLAETYPKAFQALQHVANGGKYEDLVSPQGIDYTNIQITEEDTVALKSFMQQYYQGKGFTEAKALRNVEDDQDSEEGLYANFKSALKEKQDSQTIEEKTVFENQEKTKEKQNLQDKKFGETLSTVIEAGKIGNFNVPKKEAEGFYNYVLNHVERSGQGYALTIPLTNENFSDQLQQMFFGFKKGDLSKYVSSKSKTETTRRLRKNMGKEKDISEASSESSAAAANRQAGSKLPTLGAFETD